MDGSRARILSKYVNKALNSRSAAVMDARLGTVPGSGIRASCENNVSPAAVLKNDTSCSVHIKDGLGTAISYRSDKVLVCVMFNTVTVFSEYAYAVVIMRNYLVLALAICVLVGYL